MVILLDRQPNNEIELDRESDQSWNDTSLCVRLSGKCSGL